VSQILLYITWLYLSGTSVSRHLIATAAMEAGSGALWLASSRQREAATRGIYGNRMLALSMSVVDRLWLLMLTAPYVTDKSLHDRALIDGYRAMLLRSPADTLALSLRSVL